MVRVLGREDVQRLAGMADAIAAVREAFIAADQGQAVTPAPLELRLPDADGELHVKGAYLLGASVFCLRSRPQPASTAIPRLGFRSAAG